MGLGDEIKAGAQDLVGKAKEKLGELTGERGLQAEGVKDQLGADITRAGGEVKDAVSEVKDAVSEATGAGQDEASPSLGDQVRAVGEKVKDFFDGDQDGDGSWKDK